MKAKNEKLDTDEKLNSYLNSVRIDNVIENLRVLLDEFLTDSNLDIREKAKSAFKILNANF